MLDRVKNLVSAKHTLETKERGGIPMVGNSQLMDNTKYLNFSATGMGGTFSLVDSNTKKLVGVTNFDGEKLNTGRDIVFDGVRLLKGVQSSATIASEMWTEANGWNVEGAMQNAELLLKQGGNTLLEIPVRDIIGLSPDNPFRNLSNTPLIRSNQVYQLELKFPAGISMSGGQPFNYRLEFRCTDAVAK